VHVRRSPPTLLPSIFCPDQPCLGCLTAAYTKLAALPEALKDANTAISLDPKFVKAYIRKSLVLSGMRDYTKAIEACAEATDADADKKHTREIETQIRKCYELQQQERAGETEQQTLERAMKDPEVAVSARLCRSYLLAASHIILTPPPAALTAVSPPQQIMQDPGASLPPLFIPSHANPPTDTPHAPPPRLSYAQHP
jgi:tetratricopeptide (TPR) repeat protein